MKELADRLEALEKSLADLDARLTRIQKADDVGGIKVQGNKEQMADRKQALSDALKKLKDAGFNPHEQNPRRFVGSTGEIFYLRFNDADKPVWAFGAGKNQGTVDEVLRMAKGK